MGLVLDCADLAAVASEMVRGGVRRVELTDGGLVPISWDETRDTVPSPPSCDARVHADEGPDDDELPSDAIARELRYLGVASGIPIHILSDEDELPCG